MRAIDRIMKAYAEKHRLTDAQTTLVRDEVSAFIDELLLGKAGPPDLKGPIPKS